VEQELCRWFGPKLAATEPAPFLHTAYYQREMGPDLFRQFLVFSSLRDAGELARWKHAANELEARWEPGERGGRRVNVDPGYLAPGKLVLASTKDHEHRLYLAEGIYAEVTLRIRAGRFQPWPWTYPDYAQQCEFFDRVYREYLADLKTA